MGQQGMALVLTLMAVSFLVAVTVQLATSVNWQMQSAGILQDSVQLDAMNRSGLSLVRGALAADQKENDFDSPHDSWNTIGQAELSSLFGSGTLEVDVTDLSGLLQVNALVPDKKDQKFKEKQERQIELWMRFLTPDNFEIADAAEAREIIDAIIDWIDEDDDEFNNGAESGYYLSLAPPYSARNKPVAYKEELLLIRGMTKELFYGNDDKLALSDYVTVAGREGTLNINSIDKTELLMALDKDNNMSPQVASDLIEYRNDEDNKARLGQKTWYKAVDPNLDLPKELVDVKSNYFEVSVTASYKNMKRSGRGIVERTGKKGEQKLLYWEVR